MYFIDFIAAMKSFIHNANPFLAFGTCKFRIIRYLSGFPLVYLIYRDNENKNVNILKDSSKSAIIIVRSSKTAAKLCRVWFQWRRLLKKD